MSSASMAACFNYDTTKVKAEKKDSMDSGRHGHGTSPRKCKVLEENGVPNVPRMPLVGKGVQEWLPQEMNPETDNRLLAM
ncbi:hypothetical protein MSG28_007713 [Choristoneura fumiferana]|uniref:Uncharacterized protein n=1 Tax=Choristoneura fumiferana TaxID=7141 RepID=A0ACC0JY56_CHOFU|nr:hypothetical protein MSG28_007713 [Choristoneura fumiferana]